MTLTRVPHEGTYVQDPLRLQAVVSSQLLEADQDEGLDRWTRLAKALIDAPTALVSIVTGERQVFVSEAGWDPDAERHTPLSASVCKHVVESREPLIVSDLREHPVISQEHEIIDAGHRAYAGVPVRNGQGDTLGSFCVVDTTARVWTAAEIQLLEDLSAGLQAEIELREALRRAESLQCVLQREARVDALTGLDNRRQFTHDLRRAIGGEGPTILAVYDLDGFKRYNDTFGHPAGDALLARLAANLRAAVEPREGTAYRLGGDEFCTLVHDEADTEAGTAALNESGEGFTISACRGVVDLADAGTAERALQLADDRLYHAKRHRSGPTREEVQNVLLAALGEREPDTESHGRQVSSWAALVARRLDLQPDAVEAIVRAAKLHDIGKLAVPDSILEKPGKLDEAEWAIMRQHTIVGERIIAAAPSLRTDGRIVRSTHERWDGGGYPDGLAGEAIPLAARVIAVCDAFDAITSHRAYAAAKPRAYAVNELRTGSGRQFDPRVVEAFIAATQDRPIAA